MPRIEIILTVLVWVAVIALFGRFWWLAERECAEKVPPPAPAEKKHSDGDL